MKRDLPLRFVQDDAGLRSDAWLRLIGAVVLALGSALLAARVQGPLLAVFLFLSVLIALGWTASFRRHRIPRRLELSEADLVFVDGKKESRVARGAIDAVRVDEERLEVTIVHQQGELRLPCVWQGVGLHDLASQIEDWAVMSDV